jgi:hypothetical protein
VGKLKFWTFLQIKNKSALRQITVDISTPLAYNPNMTEQKIRTMPTRKLEALLDEDNHTKQEYVWAEEELARRDFDKSVEESIYGASGRFDDMPFGC